MASSGRSLSVAELASRFESLGGGSLNANGWAFGCEFGFFQRSAGIEPLGLLRWVSVPPDKLICALKAQFADIGNEANIQMIEHGGREWGFLQTAYGIRNDHTGIDRSSVAHDVARKRASQALVLLRRKLLEDIAAAEKLFTYHTYDHTMDRETLARLAKLLEPSTLCYVQIPVNGEEPFTARRISANLIVGYIDVFAPREGTLIYNEKGWEAVCRVMVDTARMS